MKLSFVLSLFCCLSAFGFYDTRDFERVFQPGKWELKVAPGLFQSSANYSKSGGSFDSLPNGQNFQLLNVDMGTRVSLSRLMGLYVDGRYANAQSKDPTLNRTNAQFNRVLVGADLLFLNEGLQLIPDFYAVIPVAQNSADSVQTGEGAQEGTARALLRWHWGRFRQTGSAGFTYRTGGRSALIPYSLASEVSIGRSAIGGEVRGFTTIMDDDKTSTPAARETEPFRVNAGSARFNSVNPSLLEANAWYKFSTPGWALEVGGGTTLNGTNAAAGTNIFAVYRLFFQSQAKPPATQATDGFEEETQDGVNQRYFQAPTPTPKPTPDPKVNPEAARKQLQQELNQTEMKIELKPQRPKKRP